MAISPNLAQALSAFGGQIANIQAQVNRLERNQNQNNLPYSSIDNGALVVTDDTGTVRQVIGIQADGTATTVDMNGPQPGPLDAPTVTPVINGLSITWDGEFAGSTDYPSDYMMTQIHVSTTSGFTPSTATLAGVLHTAGSYTVLNLTAGTTYYVVLAALSTSGVLGELSSQVSGVPSVNSPTISPGSITTTDIAPGAVTTPILAANAVTAAKMSANSVTAGTVAAGAIDGLTITGNVINGALINAGTLTFSDAAGGGVFGYTGTVLTVALAGSPGVDANGYSYPAGFSMGQPGVPQVLLSQNSGGAQLGLPTNDASEEIAAQINSEIIGPGTASQQLALYMASPSNQNSTAVNQWNVSMTSDSSDSTIPAQFLLTDAFDIPYFSLMNNSAAGTDPILGIGTAYNAQYPVTINFNGQLITYGAGAGQTITQSWTTAGTYHWTCPVGVTSIRVYTWGAGGGGGGGSGTAIPNGGDGGGGGEFAGETTLAVTPGNVYTFVVGAGGAGGAAGIFNGSATGGTGSNGANTSFPGDSVTVTAHGGLGGYGGGIFGTPSGGTGSTNTIHKNGGQGALSGSVGPATGGAGGGSAASLSSVGNAGTGTTSRVPGAGGASPASGSGAGQWGGWGSNSNNGNAGGVNTSTGGGGGGGGGGNDGHTYGGGKGGPGAVQLHYTQPGTATILASLANVAGTDDYGNSFPTGYMGTVAAVQPGVSPSTPETWHSLSLTSGFTTSGSSWNSDTAYSQYKLMPDGSVRIRILSTVTSAPGGTTWKNIATLPVGYRPSANRYFTISWYSESINTGSNDAGGAGALYSSGALWVYGGSSGTNYMVIDVTVDLN